MHGLCERMGTDGSEWLVNVHDPSEVAKALQDGLRLVRASSQRELFEEPALEAPIAPGELEEVSEDESYSNSPGAKGASSAESRLSDAAYVLTLDGLTELWIFTSEARLPDGRRRDQMRAIKPMIEAILSRGIAPADLAAAIRARPDPFEWFQAFASRLLAGRAGSRRVSEDDARRILEEQKKLREPRK